MTQFSDEETTRPDVLHPAKEAKQEKMIEQGSAANGEVGNVSIYAKNVAKLEASEEPLKKIKGGTVAGWNRGLKGSEYGPSIGGRPTVLTPELEKELFDYLEKGYPVSLCCRLVGIDNSTLTKWRTQERQGKSVDLSRFFIDFMRARAIGELNVVSEARRGDGREFSHGPAKCAQWLLERAFGDKYAPRLNMKVDEMTSLTLDAVTKVCSDKDCGCYEALLAAFQELSEARDNEDSLTV